MNFVNAFQKIGLTVAAILFSCAALFYSINPAQADNPTITNEAGKIMIDQNSFVHNGTYYFHILAWDTETGKSKLYSYKQSSGTIGTTNYQLPSSPVY
jgi:hypothetical protein